MTRVSTEGLRPHRPAMAACAAALLLASPLLRAQKPAAPPVAPPAAVSGATLDRVRDAGKIRIGYRADVRPFSFRNDAGVAEGYAVTLCQKVADAVKAGPGLGTLRVEWVPVPADKRVTAVQQGDVDLFCGPDAITLAARRDVAFSIPVFPGGVGALVRADTPTRLRDVLSGRATSSSPLWRAHATQVLQAGAFSVIAGTATEQWLAGRMKDLEVRATVAPVSAIEAGVLAVRTGRADAFFAERSLLLDAAARSAGDLAVIDRLFTYTPLAMVFRRGDDDFRLLVDRVLSQVYASSEIGSLYTKWFGQPDDSTLTFFRWNALPE